MDFFEKYKFISDNPDEFGINIKKFKKSEILDESHLSNLLFGMGLFLKKFFLMFLNYNL